MQDAVQSNHASCCHPIPISVLLPWELLAAVGGLVLLVLVVSGCCWVGDWSSPCCCCSSNPC